MKFTVADGEKYQKVMEAEVPVEEMALAMKQASKRIAQKVNIPGFRKGKAPQSIIETFVGIDSVLQEAADEILSQAYFNGIQELKLEPVEQPKIEMVQLSAHQPMIFKATFAVRPEIQLGDYKGLAVTKYVRLVEDSAVEADIESQRQRLGRLTDAEDGAITKEKDVVSIDFEGFKDGVPFEGGKGVDYPLELGSNTFIPGFEEQLVGLKVGDEKEVNVTFPESYQEKTLAGQPATFQVTVKGIKHRVMPELDDVFAQEVSETADTLEALKAEVRERLENQNREAGENAAREQALQLAVENATIDVPPVMVEQRLDQMVQNMAERLQSQGLQLDQFLQYSGQTLQEFREGYREQAEANVKSDLVLEEIVKAEQFEISEEELQKHLELMAQNYYQPAEQIREIIERNNQLENVYDSLKMQKALDLVYDAAKVTEEMMAVDTVEPEVKEVKKAAKKSAKKDEEIKEENLPETTETEKTAAKKKPAARKTSKKAAEPAGAEKAEPTEA